jgi:hypothetical protein
MWETCGLQWVDGEDFTLVSRIFDPLLCTIDISSMCKGTRSFFFIVTAIDLALGALTLNGRVSFLPMSSHNFDPLVARRYGMTEAVLIKNFQFWISHNKRNGRHQFEGRTWTYNSAKALSQAFVYLSPKQIYGAICRLEKVGVLIKSNFNDHKYDRTSWYAFTDEGFWIDRTEELHFPAEENGKPGQGSPIPDTLPDSNIDKNPPGSSALARGAKEEVKKVEPKKPAGKKQADKRPPREFWQAFVDTWHDFHVENCNGEAPSIVGKPLTDLGKLYDLLLLRARRKKAAWTEKYMVDALKFFLVESIKDDWLKKHLTVANLVEQFDPIFVRAAGKNGGKPPAKPFAEEIQYIIERWNEGDMDQRLITPELYKKLEEKQIVPMGYREQFTGKDPEEQKCNAVRGWLDYITKKTPAT